MLAEQKTQIYAANRLLLVDVFQYVSLQSAIFAINLNLFFRHEILKGFLR